MPVVRIVVDTNVLVSALFFGGQPKKILLDVERRKYTPCFIPSTISELTAVLKYDKFTRQRALLDFSIADFIVKLEQYSLFFPEPKEKVTFIQDDPSDNKFLACALSAKASFIISGDRHLLALKSFSGIPIATPAQFFKLLKKSQT